MGPKFRIVYLIGGFTGLGFLICYFVVNILDCDPKIVMEIAIPDMVFVYLAYKTYPDESRIRVVKSYYNT